MTEQTFRSPNFYETEVDLSLSAPTSPSGTPAGVIGTADKGPAFVPVTVGNRDQFTSVFGKKNPNHFGVYAASEFLENRNSLTYIRVLGSGANLTEADVVKSQAEGRVRNAGFYLNGTASPGVGSVQYVVASHDLTTEEAIGMPLFTDNDSVTTPGGKVSLVRAMLMTPETARVMVVEDPMAAFDPFTNTDQTNVDPLVFNGKIKIVISSSLGNSFRNTDGLPGINVLTASLNPSDDDYLGKVFNTDPDKFLEEQHFLYADFPVDAELAVANGTLAVVSGSAITSTKSGDPALPMKQAFGAFDARYSAPTTPWFISQPFGSVEYDLFKLESLDDGEYANTLYKISISNLKASQDDSDKWGSFTVNVRDWSDTDFNPIVLESFNCSLNPTSNDYIARVIGDTKLSFNFDSVNPSERRLLSTGKYGNKSKYVRVVVSNDVEKGFVSPETLPFGFRGFNLPKTNVSLSDANPGADARLEGNIIDPVLSGAILPPIPFRTKVTKGTMNPAPSYPGESGSTETPLSLLHWGVKFERNTDPLNSNVVAEKNRLLNSLTKFLGIEKLDVLTRGEESDVFNNNKFTLARVALANDDISNLTGSVNQQMRNAFYVRNGLYDLTNYTISAGMANRLTLATLLSELSPAEFNRYSQYAKFTTFMSGGWDGTNLLDFNARRLGDKSTSFDAPEGCASSSYVSPGFSVNFAGSTTQNSSVMAYKVATDMMTNTKMTNVNILAIPGLREEFLTDHAMQKVADQGLSYYVMDIPSYDDDQNRRYIDSKERASVSNTVSSFDSRVIDNNYTGTYFPDIIIKDDTNKRRVKVPASVAAMGALAFNDRISYPWYAPAGFNRASLDFVTGVDERLNVSDRDVLYDSRINPIATFPRLGYVIYGQKTLQISRSALDRVNVRRLLNEVKRVVISAAKGLVFENNTRELRANFVSQVSFNLAIIQSQSGIEGFRVVMDETNNTVEDAEGNKVNGRIAIIPTRSVEFIALDFIVTSSGVEFL